MPAIRFTAFFADDDGHGWSEQHDADGGTGSINLTSFLAAFDNLMKAKRVPLLCGDSFYLGCRASYKTTDGKIASANQVPDQPVRGPQTQGAETLNMGPPEAAVKLRIQNAASTANSDIYLRGFPRQVIEAGIIQFASPIGSAWKAKMVQYFDALKANAYGWVGINPATTSRGDVTSYTVNGQGHVAFTVAPTNGVVLPAAGTKMEVNFARINNSESVLNRALLCRITDAITITTVRKVAAGAFVSDGTYIAPVKGLIPYDHIGYWRLAQRKTGRPFGVGRGRLSARPLS